METALKRRIGPGLLTAYGVGVMVGAGIYVIVGAVAETAGIWAPLAFLLTSLVALPSALAYSELAARMPVAAGEAIFVEAGFNRHWLALLVGLAIVVSGIVVTMGALTLPVASLARITSGVFPGVFLLVNASLITIKRKQPEAPFRIPDWMLWFGLLATTMALVAGYGGVL